MKQGLIQIYTGEGKGKTTAAVGLALRARGHNLKIGYIFFHKEADLVSNIQKIKQPYDKEVKRRKGIEY